MMEQDPISPAIASDHTSGNKSVINQSGDDLPLVLQDLQRFMARTDPSSLFDASAMAVPVAAISALLGVVQRSKAETMMGLQDELKHAADLMMDNFHSSIRYGSSIALQSGCELFLKYITRAFLETPNFEECRQTIVERGERFQMISLAARDRIARNGCEFIPDGAVVMTHGFSRVVAATLFEASRRGKHFDVIILEGRPDAAGARAAKFYADKSIPVMVVLDSAMGYFMESVDLVLVGAEGVLENGAVVNKIGTCALAACAQAEGKPFYVAAESYKFARLFPFHQRDLPSHNVNPVKVEFVDTTVDAKQHPASTGIDGQGLPMSLIDISGCDFIRTENPPVDLTQAKFISLLFTDLGVLTPSAVSDELIRLYQ